MRQHPDKHGSLMASTALTGTLGYLAVSLWPGHFGPEVVKFASVSAGVLGGICAMSTASLAIQKTQRVRRIFRAFGRSDEQGSAELLSEGEAKAAGLDQMIPGSRFVGILGGTALWPWTETHTLIIGPAGSAKSSSQIMNHLACNGDSALVSDVKGELSETTAKMRSKKFGHRIIKLDPTSEDSACINPLDAVFVPLMDSSPLALLRARGIAMQLYPEPETEGANKFFRDGTRILIATIMLSVAATCPAEKRNLSTVYRAFTDEIFLNALLMDAGRSSLLSREVAHMADDAHAMAFGEGGSTKTYEQFRIGAMQALEAFGPGNYLARISASTDMSFKVLKEEPSTIYLTVESRLAETLGRWVGLMQWLAAEELLEARNNKPVQFVLDEFCNSPLHGLPKILTLLRSYGIKVTMATQDLDDITRVYGKHALETIISETSIKLFLGGILSKSTLEFLSAYLGEKTLNSSSFSVEKNDIRENISKGKRSLMTGDEIRRLDEKLQIIFIKNLKPIIARKVPVFAIDPWRKEIAPNSMYGGRRYLLPVQLIIKDGQSIATRLGRTVQKKSGNRIRILAGLWQEFAPPRVFGLTLVLVMALLWAGFPHLRWSYTYSGSHSKPKIFHRCDYIGPQPFTQYWDCPIVIFKKLW